MDATIMRSTTLLAAKLAAQYPQFQFQGGESFRWSPAVATIFYEDSEDEAFLLHELSHALLGHTSYKKDLELIEMERDAWQRTRELASEFNLELEEDSIEDALDTYRDWLHARSQCPTCAATGIQTHGHTYRCISCETSWRVNEARLCGLKRYVIKPAKKHTI